MDTAAEQKKDCALTKIGQKISETRTAIKTRDNIFGNIYERLFSEDSR